MSQDVDRTVDLPPDGHPPGSAPVVGTEHQILPLRPVPTTDDPPTVVSKKSNPVGVGPSSAGISALLQGAKLAHFELISPLGSGGMAAVLLARDTQLDRQVALKILPPENATDADSVQRFHQEARSAARLDHDHIVRVFFCGEDQGLHFIAFEYVQGETLKSLLDKKGRIDEADGLLYLEQLATALHHASQRGVVHRDIKPSNVLVTPENKAKLADMGLARNFGPKDNGLTQSGVTLGTFDYISPEQALDPRTADPRSDIYSLGCTFYHVLTGKPPVPDGPPAMKLAHHQQVMPADPRQFVPNMDPRLVSLLSDMMAKDPERRPQSAETLLERVREIRQKPVPSSRLWLPSAALWSSKPLHRKKDRSVYLAMASLAFVLIAMVIGLSRLTGDPKSDTPDKIQSDQSANINPENENQGTPVPNQGTNSVGKPPAEPRSRVARYQPLFPSLSDLKEWLERHSQASEIELVLSGDLDLSPQGDQPPTGINLQAKRVVIRAADPNRPARVIFRYQGRTQTGSSAFSSLSIDAETIEISDVQFLMDARMGNATIDSLRIRPTRQAELRRCLFVQAQVAMDENNRVTSLHLENRGSSDPIVRLQECVFLGFKHWDSSGDSTRISLKGAEWGGQDAITRTENVDLYMDHCAMGPHERFITLGRSQGRVETSVRMTQCTAILGSASDLFYVDPSAQPAISLSYSLIAMAPGGKKSSDPKPLQTGNVKSSQTTNSTLLFVAGPIGQITYRATENRYQFSDKFYFLEESISPLPVTAKTMDDFQKALAMRSLGEDESRLIDFNPFKNPNALSDLNLEISEANKADTLLQQANQIAAVFAALDTLSDLRPDDNPTSRLVGTERCGPVDYLASKLPPIEPKRTVASTPMDPASGKIRIVDPEKDDSSKGVYPTLEQAIFASKSGDEIQIRHQGPLRCKSINLEDPTHALVIRAYPGFRPILTLLHSTQENASLFRLDGAKLRLEELEFAIEPGQLGHKSVSLATLSRPGHLVLNRCSVTLDPGRKTTPLALVTMLDTTGMMRMEEMDSRLWKVELDQTIVRGNGNVVSNPVGRSIEMDARQSLFSLEGSVLTIEPSLNPGKNLEAGEGIIVKWNKNTSWLSGNFMRLQSLGGNLTIPVTTSIKDSILAVSPGNSLIRMERTAGDSDTPMEKLPERFHWEAAGNAYANMKEMVQTSSTFDPNKDPATQFDYYGLVRADTTSKVVSLTQPGSPMNTAMKPNGKVPYSRWTPSQVISSWKNVSLGKSGADLEQLPVPTTLPKSRE